MKRTFSCIVLVMLLSLIAVAQERQTPAGPNGNSAPLLVIESMTHDFGEVKSGTPLRYAFKIKNEGKADLLINNVAPSWGCTRGDYDKVVPPGKEGKIELAVEHTEGLSGEVAKSASVTTNDPKKPTFNLFLRARFTGGPGGGTPAPPPLNNNIVFAVEPSDRFFTSALARGSSSSALHLYNQQEKPARVTKIIPGGDSFTATLQTIQDGKRYEIIVSSNPALKPGHYTQPLKALTDSKSQPEVSIQLDLDVFPKVAVSPPSITMPLLPVTADLETINWPMIYVRKIREQGLKIKKYSSTLPFIKLELLTETEGQVYKLQLKLDRSKIKPGEFKGAIRIETNDPDLPVVEVPVQAAFK